MKTFSRHLQDVFQNVFKTYLQGVFKTISRRRLAIVLKTSWKTKKSVSNVKSWLDDLKLKVLRFVYQDHQRWAIVVEDFSKVKGVFSFENPSLMGWTPKTEQKLRNYWRNHQF